jgi:hypothetical protein
VSDRTYLPAAAGTGDVQLTTQRTSIRGFSARETTGNAAVFVVRDGTAPSDPGVFMVSLSAGESIQFEFADGTGMAFQRGVFLDRVTGTTEVAVWA